MIYLKFWKQACVPTLLFGAEIWSFTSAHLEKLERCQRWFIKRLFHLPDYTSNEILAIVSGIPPVATLINQKKLYFLGRIVTLPKIPYVVKAVMKSRLLDFFEGGNSSPHGFLHDIACLLEKDKLMTCALLENSSLFPSCCKWKAIVNSRQFRIHDSRPEAVGLEVPNLKLVLSAFTCRVEFHGWEIVAKVFALLVNLTRRTTIISFSYKALRPELDLFWSKLFSLIETKASFEADVIINFLRSLDDHNKVLLLTGGLKLPFQRSASVSVVRCIMVSVHKLVRIRERLVARGIITPNRSSFSSHVVAHWPMNDAFSLHHVLT